MDERLQAKKNEGCGTFFLIVIAIIALIAYCAR